MCGPLKYKYCFSPECFVFYHQIFFHVHGKFKRFPNIFQLLFGNNFEVICFAFDLHFSSWLQEWFPEPSDTHSLWRRANARNVSFTLITVANLHFQLSWYNQIALLPHRRSTTVSLETFTLYSFVRHTVEVSKISNIYFLFSVCIVSYRSSSFCVQFMAHSRL